MCICINSGTRNAMLIVKKKQCGKTTTVTSSHSLIGRVVHSNTKIIKQLQADIAKKKKNIKRVLFTKSNKHYHFPQSEPYD